MKRIEREARKLGRAALVAFTPKGGCPLKPYKAPAEPFQFELGSIHPQGWVPVETAATRGAYSPLRGRPVAFTPKGGCPLKHGSAKK